MRQEREKNYHDLECLRGSKLLVYATSTKQGMETQIASDILPIFSRHLDAIGKVHKISLFLYTNGGNVISAWSLVNLIRSFCDEFEVIVPSNCFSSGTLICLGANSIVMTKQASLGPIDPSVNGPLNPQIPGINDPNAKIPVSVEYIKGYLEMAKEELGIISEDNLTQIYLSLSEKIHPLTLGQVYKSKMQIRMLAQKLLSSQNIEEQKKTDIIEFLCSGTGSHDYSIRRDEAFEQLGLPIEKPNDELYRLINAIFQDICNELDLETPFRPDLMISQNPSCSYSVRRGLIESLSCATDVYVTNGIIESKVVSNPMNPMIQQQITNNKTLNDGWCHES